MGTNVSFSIVQTMFSPVFSIVINAFVDPAMENTVHCPTLTAIGNARETVLRHVGESGQTLSLTQCQVNYIYNLNMQKPFQKRKKNQVMARERWTRCPV